MRKKRTGPQKRGKSRWHISAIRLHLLKYHKNLNENETETNELPPRPLQENDHRSTERIEEDENAVLSFPEPSPHLPLKRRKRVIEDSPVIPAKRTRSTRSKLC